MDIGMEIANPHSSAISRPIGKNLGGIMSKTAEVSVESLQITQLQVFPIRENQGKTRAFARVLLNEQLQLTGLRVMDGSNGLFVAYPNDPSYKGDDYRSIYYPITRGLREMIESAVLEKYQETLAA